jgi:hypothetical protein
MNWNKYVRIVVILGMVVVMCGTVNAAGMGIGAETHETSGVSAPACAAPCECMSDTTAIAKWGLNGYDQCSKTVCGQSANANVQYYCFHQVGSPVPVTTNALVQAPVSSTAIPSAPIAAGVTQKSPVALASVFAAVYAALLVSAMVRRK